MARIRTVKPEFWSDDKILNIPPLARLAFIGTFNFADDAGNIDRSSNQLKARIFPGDMIEVEPLILDILGQGLMVEYEVDGKKYLHIRNFDRHQRINRPSAPTCPAFQGAITEDSVSPQGAITEDSVPEGKGKEGKGGEKEKPPLPPKGNADALFDEFWQAYPRKVAPDKARKAWDKRKVDALLSAQMVQAIERQRQTEAWIKDGGKFIPYPASWLNNGEWLNKLEIDGGNNGKGAGPSATNPFG
jgi:hypothetical protein